MSDGAHLGFDAESSMHAALGGPQPAKTGMDPVEMRAYLESHPTSAIPQTYEASAAIAGHMVLQYLLDDPSRSQIPTETVYARGDDGLLIQDDAGGLQVEHVGLYHVMKADGIPLDRLELSGFQWGWAVNAARYCVGLGPVANPAIVTIEVPE